MINKNATDRYIEQRGMSTKYRTFSVDAYRTAHGKGSINSVKINCRARVDDELGLAIAKSIQPILQDKVQELLNKMV